ncbi:MAG: lysophospholipid acyltransferase family protein [Bacteroidales bacterium]|jgi:KDO2-lipid IV(A) lauroyltransferase|nr:lysophospholipid acyltransferase family protein [Bacteroidales bacterium]
MKKFFEYAGFRLLVGIFYIIPFPVLYIISDFVYFMIYKVIKYRRPVVYDNLKQSFPEKTEEEINKLSKAFYHHLADITLESLKGMTISLKSLKKRYEILNTGVANEYFNENKSILCFTSHYGNWEYGILATDNAIKHQAVALYLPLTNKYSEKYGLKRRGRFGTWMVAVQDTKKVFSESYESPLAIILAADQNPSNPERSIWVRFLNRDTACLHGPEAYAKKTNFPVVYLKISKPKRGYYTLEIEKLIDNPSEYAPGEITQIYMNKLEKDILRKPEYWLWSHRRWKHSRNIN